MRIDPHAWLLTVPLTIGLVQLYLLPAESFAKRCWRFVDQSEALVWHSIGGKPAFHSNPLARKAAFALLLFALAMSSVASFAAFIGWMPAG